MTTNQTKNGNDKPEGKPGQAVDQAQNRPKSKTVRLFYPVTIHQVVDNKPAQKTYGELTLRPPKAKDNLLVNMDLPQSTDAERELVLFANLCGVSREVIEELQMADYFVLQREYMGFLSPPPPKQEES